MYSVSGSWHLKEEGRGVFCLVPYDKCDDHVLERLLIGVAVDASDVLSATGRLFHQTVSTDWLQGG